MAGESCVATHLLVKRGVGITRRTPVLFEHLARWDGDGLYLDLSTLEFLSLPRTMGGDGNPAPLSLSGRTPITLQDGYRLRLSGLRLVSTDLATSHLLVRRPWPRQRAFLLPMNSVAPLDSGQVTATIGHSDLRLLPAYRPDAAIEQDLWDALYQSGDISPVDLNGIRVVVEEGAAVIEGNVRTPAVVSEASKLAVAVPGVARVENRLANDRDIELGIAEAIAGLEPGLSGNVQVNSHLGSVVLRGHVASDHLIQATLRAATEGGGVRSVENGIEIRPRAG